MARDIVIPKPNTCITPFLELPKVKYPDTTNHKPSGRAITSVDFRRQLMEKKRKKKPLKRRLLEWLSAKESNWKSRRNLMKK